MIKIEHPDLGDPLRGHGRSKSGVGLWWKIVGRNKRCVALDLSKPDGAELLLRLASRADVLVESFRPGTLERWGLGEDRLHEVNPALVVIRVTGFGQEGPYASRPAFGTLIEAMSGFAAMTGEPGRPPTLPPFGLADGIAGLAGALAAMMALYHRDAPTRTPLAPAGTGVPAPPGNEVDARGQEARGQEARGQVVDLSILEPLVSVLGPHPTNYDQLGEVPERVGNRSSSNAPRNTYRTADGGWVAVSTSTRSIATRLLELVGHGEVTKEPWFATGAGRAEHADLLDSYVATYVSARSTEEVLAAFAEAEAAAAPVYDVAGLMADPQVMYRKVFTSVSDEELGEIVMQNVLFKMESTPGSVRFAGRALGADTEAVLSDELGIGAEELAELRVRGVVA